jgi:hypothetical protein
MAAVVHGYALLLYIQICILNQSLTSEWRKVDKIYVDVVVYVRTYGE